MSKRNFRLRQSYWLIHGSLHERVDFGKVAHYTHLIWFYIADMVMVKAIGSCICLISGAPNILWHTFLVVRKAIECNAAGVGSMGEQTRALKW